jgi:3-oxoadipate enol-lactonase
LERLLVNGISVHVEEMGPSDAPVVLMSNSLAADVNMWAAQARQLAQSYRVIRFDARGHGQTEATDDDYSLDLLAEDALSLLDALGIEKVHFVGLSLGGMIGQLLAVRAPHRLLSLVLCATFASTSREMWDQRVKAARADGLGPLVEPTLERWLTPGFRAARPDVAEAVRAMIARTSPEGYAGCAAAIRDMDLIDAAPLISLPTLLLAAADDPSAPPETMSELHERIEGARFVVLEDAAHLFTMEQPDRATQIIEEFLEEVTQELRSQIGGPGGVSAGETRLG